MQHLPCVFVINMIKSSFAVLFKVNNMITRAYDYQITQGLRVSCLTPLSGNDISMVTVTVWKYSKALCSACASLAREPSGAQALEHNELLKQADKDLLWAYESASAQAIVTQDTGDSFRSAVSEFITYRVKRASWSLCIHWSSLIDSSLLCCL